MCERNLYALATQMYQGGISVEENNIYETPQLPDSELILLISDGINRDLRRYPNRFNSEDE